MLLCINTSSVCFLPLSLLSSFCSHTVQVRGVGLEGESAAEEVLLFCHRERPSGSSQLLSGESEGDDVSEERSEMMCERVMEGEGEGGREGGVMLCNKRGRQTVRRQ